MLHGQGHARTESFNDRYDRLLEPFNFMEESEIQQLKVLRKKNLPFNCKSHDHEFENDKAFMKNMVRISDSVEFFALEATFRRGSKDFRPAKEFCRSQPFIGEEEGCALTIERILKFFEASAFISFSLLFQPCVAPQEQEHILLGLFDLSNGHGSKE